MLWPQAFLAGQAIVLDPAGPLYAAIDGRAAGATPTDLDPITGRKPVTAPQARQLAAGGPLSCAGLFPGRGRPASTATVVPSLILGVDPGQRFDRGSKSRPLRRA